MKHRPRQLTTLKAVSNAATGLLGSFLLLFVSDRVWDTPPWMRMVILGGGLGTATFSILWWLKRRIYSSQPDNHLAEFIQRHNDPPGDQLPEAVDLGRRRICVVPVLMLLTLTTALLIVLPTKASRSTLVRWMQPMSREPRFTFVQIEGLPKELVVAHGEPFELSFAVACQSFWRPKTVTASFGGESSRKATVSYGRARFEFSGQTEPRPLLLQAGDFSLRLEVRPLLRPELTEVAALVSLPAYLGRPPRARPLQNGKLQVIEGSRVVLKGLASRSLRNAWLNGSTRLSVASSMVLTEEFNVSKDEEMTLTWEDWHGLRSQDPMQITVVAQADQPPKIAILNLGKTVVIREDEVLKLALSADDDFGLEDIGIVFEIHSAKGVKKIAHHEGELRLKEGCPKTDSLAVTYSFSPSELDIPAGSLVKLRATARDFRPGRKASVSQEHQILILGEVEESELASKELAKLSEGSGKIRESK